MKKMRVRAIAKGFGGTPPSRRRPGEVFDVPATRKRKVFSEPDLRGYQKVIREEEVPNTADWYQEVDARVPAGRPARRQEAQPDMVRRDGKYEPATKLGISGGGDPVVIATEPAAKGDDLAG